MHKNGWTDEEDLITAEIVLRYLREGRDMGNAYAEISRRIGRTPAAIQRRWSRDISDRYDAAIDIAKASRTKRKQKRLSNVRDEIEQLEDYLKRVFKCLDNIKREIE